MTGPVMASIFDFPDVYAKVLMRSPDEVSAEVQTVCGLMARHGLAVGKVLDIACGTGVHAVPLAKRGHHVLGLDLSAAMIDVAQRAAESAGVASKLTLHQGDFTDFSLHGETVDCAMFTFETFPLIVDDEQLRSHFKSVRRHLRPGGLYIVDVDVPRAEYDTERSIWGRRTVALGAGDAVEIWNESLPGNPQNATSHMVMHCRIRLGAAVHETVDDWVLKCYTPGSLRRLVETQAGFALEGFCSWKELSEELAGLDHYFMVLKAV